MAPQTREGNAKGMLARLTQTQLAAMRELVTGEVVPFEQLARVVSCAAEVPLRRSDVVRLEVCDLVRWEGDAAVVATARGRRCRVTWWRDRLRLEVA